MSMDGVTAGLLLGAAMNGAGNDKVADLYKMFNAPEKNAPTHADILKLFAAVREEWPIGTRVKQRGTIRCGSIVSHNISTTGLYPGWRYPINVKWDAVCFKENRSMTFEYDPIDVEKIDMDKDVELIYTNFLDSLLSCAFTSNELTERLVRLLNGMVDHPQQEAVRDAVLKFHAALTLS